MKQTNKRIELEKENERHKEMDRPNGESNRGKWTLNVGSWSVCAFAKSRPK